MASTYTTNLRLEKQGSGDNPNTWGLVLNNAVIDLIDSAVAAYTTIDVETDGSDVNLTASNGASDQSRSATLEFAGSLGNNTNVVIPSNSKMYIINDQSVRENDPTLTIKTASGTGLTVPASMSGLIYCDSVSVYAFNGTGLGLGTAANANLVDISEVGTAVVNGVVDNSTAIVYDNPINESSWSVGDHVVGTSVVPDTFIVTVCLVDNRINVGQAQTLADDTALSIQKPVSAAEVIIASVGDIRYPRTSVSVAIIGARSFKTSIVALGPAIQAHTVVDAAVTASSDVTLDLSTNNNFLVSLESPATLTNPSNPSIGQTGHIYLIQDAVGSRTLSFGTQWNFPGGTTPTLSTSINSIDMLVYNIRASDQIDSVLLKEFS